MADVKEVSLVDLISEVLADGKERTAAVISSDLKKKGGGPADLSTTTINKALYHNKERFIQVGTAGKAPAWIIADRLIIACGGLKIYAAPTFSDDLLVAFIKSLHERGVTDLTTDARGAELVKRAKEG
jgi:hypothetical protein